MRNLNCIESRLFYLSFGGMLVHSSEKCNNIIYIFDIDNKKSYISNVRSPLKSKGFAIFSKKTKKIHLFDKYLKNHFSILLSQLID